MSSWFRVHLGISWDGVWSDYRLASTVLAEERRAGTYMWLGVLAGTVTTFCWRGS